MKKVSEPHVGRYSSSTLFLFRTASLYLLYLRYCWIICQRTPNRGTQYWREGGMYETYINHYQFPSHAYLLHYLPHSNKDIYKIDVTSSNHSPWCHSDVISLSDIYRAQYHQLVRETIIDPHAVEETEGGEVMDHVSTLTWTVAPAKPHIYSWIVVGPCICLGLYIDSMCLWIVFL